MLYRRRILHGILLPLLVLVSPAFADSRVLVVANSAFEGSEKVARHYLKQREIPETQLVLLDLPTSETISREAFNSSLRNPLLQTLLDRGLVDGLGSRSDDFGRLSPVIMATELRYVVLCYGVPLRIANEQIETLDDLTLRRAAFTGSNIAMVDAFTEGPMAKNEASVDAELALLLLRGVPLNGFVPNPFFRRGEPSIATDLALKVTRLDGPSAQAVVRMIDQALQGERDGLMGRAYVDEDGRGGGFAMGNQWLSEIAGLFRELGYDLTHDTQRAVLAADGRFDQPVLYAGWYATNLSGPFALPRFNFPPGAIAVHLHSFSASTIRSNRQRWVGPLVDRGVSATLGNVYEPYLHLTHHLNAFFTALANGWNFADAAYFALPGLSWQAVAVGDPLFRPFATDVNAQIAAQQQVDAMQRDPYLILRQYRLLLARDDSEGAERLLRRAMFDSPGIAIALAQADQFIAAEDSTSALRTLRIFSMLQPAHSTEWGLYAGAADRLHQLDDATAALAIYQSLLDARGMPDAVRLAFMKRAIPVAQSARRPELATEWQAILNPPQNP
jgi:uncharacterized protein (TIGR03790 family)